MKIKPLLAVAAAAALVGCGSTAEGPYVAPQTKNAYDLDSPEGRAIMNKAPVPGASQSSAKSG